MHLTRRILPLSLLFCLASAVALQGQSLRALEKAADKAIAAKDYYTAMVHLQEALTRAPEKPALLYRYAEVARRFHAYPQAAKHYRKVLDSREADAFPDALFHLAEVEKIQGNYEAAENHFRQFLAEKKGSPSLLERARREAEACRWAAELRPDTAWVVENLGRRINSPYSDFAALERGDTLYYTSYRFDFKEDSYRPRRRLAKILSSRRGSRGRTLPRKFNEAQRHTAFTAFSHNGKRIYFAICSYTQGVNIRCELYYREKDRRRRWSRQPVKLPESINLPGFTATQPAIGFDSTLQKEVLFFASDRPGGKGKLDLWFVTVDGKSFGTPQNLEALNTPEDDLAPFFHTPSQTLYFSSEGHPGLGSFDVFRAARRASGWGEVVNLGLPFNSSYADLHFTLDDSGQKGYLSSNRPGSMFLDREYQACCFDIWRVRKKPPPQPSPES
ncbi:MAG: tetratricopeptide repeat protein, partial [Bacteroidetes bacterium]